MKRYKLTDNFYLDEFIHPDIYRKFGNKSVWFIDQRMVYIAQALRDDMATPAIINNWATGGNYKSSGVRVMAAKVGAKYSQHKYGRAIDIKFGSWQATKEAYDFILVNQDKYMELGLTTLENIKYTPTWLHLDCRLTAMDQILIVKP